ncbi:hypothetical protein E2C01_067038 [Portunus trituberculatus]|uniref:Uncharacterized protein n=1 Tax=Portunus trituberculatus TaxID=210409 RepID=A0A5B7HSJ8_PORTR|nr:hypothetical protein [Portunus trituberculatus]
MGIRVTGEDKDLQEEEEDGSKAGEWREGCKWI